MSRHEDSLMWLLTHHVEAVISIVEVGIASESIKVETALEYLKAQAIMSDSIWEENLWNRVAEGFKKPPVAEVVKLESGETK
jgi:hypothetical protein|tara:strand:+ start:3865 stop:4110 length:246 start_codon:yes stop_codon:yes gene_type:complete